jgi:hypothetical protein
MVQFLNNDINPQKGAPAYLHLYNTGTSEWAAATADDFRGGGGVLTLESGDASATVSGLNLGYDPSFYSVEVLKPLAESTNVLHNTLYPSISSDGFSVYFDPSIPSSGYALGYIPVK